MYWKHSSSLWSGKANEGGQGKQNQKVDLYKQCKLRDVALKCMSERIWKLLQVLQKLQWSSKSQLINLLFFILGLEVQRSS